MIDRTYRCNLCGVVREPSEIYGLFFAALGAIERRKAPEVEHHICYRCFAGIQELPSVCGAGYLCSGGFRCQSDHK